MWRWFAPLCQRWAEGKEGITFWKCSDSSVLVSSLVLCGALTKTLLSSPVMEALIHRGRLWVPHMCRQEPCWNKSRTLNLYSLIPSVNLLQRISNSLLNGLFKMHWKNIIKWIIYVDLTPDKWGIYQWDSKWREGNHLFNNGFGPKSLLRCQTSPNPIRIRTHHKQLKVIYKL